LFKNTILKVYNTLIYSGSLQSQDFYEVFKDIQWYNSSEMSPWSRSANQYSRIFARSVTSLHFRLLHCNIQVQFSLFGLSSDFWKGKHIIIILYVC